MTQKFLIPATDTLVEVLTDRAVTPPAVETLEAWWTATAATRARGGDTVVSAAIGGVCADRLGFAFAAGYAEALRLLCPPSGDARVSALCATEEGGAHPRAIKTTMVRDGDGWRVSGRKRWATIASLADELLVVASTGVDEAGRNRLRVVRIAAGAPGVTLVPASAAFVPEIPHAAVELDGVRVRDADVLPGDGYEQYLKPFRTHEDLHVHAALGGYLVGVVRRHGFAPELGERVLAITAATCALAAVDASAPGNHLALAGVIDLMTAQVEAIERAWAEVPDEEWTRWQRDRPLLRVAGGARAARRDKARAGSSIE